MNLYRLIVAVSVALLTAPLPAAAAETLVSPSWTSDQVRAARPTGAEDALIFDVREEKQGGQGQTRGTTSTVTLTQSSAQIVSGTDHSIDDYTLCRTFAWSDGKPVFQNINCYAVPAFRITELNNRIVLAGALAHANLASSALDPEPYWAEAELGVQQTPSDPLIVSHANDGIEYRLKDQVVVRMTGSATKLRDDEAWRVTRYFARHWPLHPQSRRDLRTGTNLPARIEMATKEMSGTQTEILTISNLRRNKVSYPLPPGLGSTLRVTSDSGSGPMQRGIHQALLAIDGRSAIAKPTPEALLARIHEAAAQGHSVEVMLLFSELGQQYKSWFIAHQQRSIMAELRPLLQKAGSDPAASMFVQTQFLSGSAQAAGDRQAAARYLAEATTMDQMPFGTFRYVTFANLVRISPGSSKWDPAIFKHMPPALVDDYWTHIAAYPWAANAYKDLGDDYIAGYNTLNAWLAFDLGREVDPNWQDGPMAEVAAYEKKLRLAQPEFF
jgi:hypothetical protein